jgi:hypothetical protein
MASMTLVAGLALLAALGEGTRSARPVSLVLAPVSVEALYGCRAADLDAALRRALRGGKRFRLEAAPEPAGLRLEVLECSDAEQDKARVTQRSRPVSGPTKHGGVTRGNEEEIEFAQEALRTVGVRARVFAGSRFLDLASSPKDRNLREAADTLRRALDRALAERGTWLLEPRP